MPPFFDVQQIDDSIRLEAMPALEHFAANPSLRRFDREEPPPYVSSESEDETAFHPALAPENSSTFGLRDCEALIDPPLSDEEQVGTAYMSQKAYDPGQRFRDEAAKEQERLSDFCYRGSNDRVKEFLQEPARRAGRQRWSVIVRRNIRRRWQKLGVWNPQWGIPGRASRHPNDDPDTWKWTWQHSSSADMWGTTAASKEQHPVLRAIRLRQGLLYGQHNPPPPFSSLGKDATGSQAESFIISRPWFAYVIELFERTTRLRRIPHTRDTLFYQGPRAKPVREWWKERGDWREDWSTIGTKTCGLGWKWRHESPSPEPEDLTALNTDNMEDMDFTPSERDALEEYVPPTPRKPRSMPDEASRRNYPPCTLFGFRSPSPADGAPEPSQDAPVSPPRRQRRGRPRRDEADAPREPAQLRRSARIRAMQANNEPDRKRRMPTAATAVVQSLPAPSPVSLSARQRRSASRPVPARPPPPAESRRGRGRPRKVDSSLRPSAVSKVSARVAPRTRGRGAKTEAAAAAAAAAAVVAEQGRTPTAATAVVQPLPAPAPAPVPVQARQRRSASRPVPARPPPPAERPRGRGRPRKVDSPSRPSAVSKVSARVAPRTKGRSAKTEAAAAAAAAVVEERGPTTTTSPLPAAKRRRGRPKKHADRG